MRSIAALLVIAALAARAAADPPDDVIARSLVLAPGAVEAALALESNLGAGAVTDPISIAPDAWYGATPRLTIGVVHSANALSLVGSGDGVCLGGVAHGCEQAYSNLGLEARWSLAAGEWSAAAHARLVVRRWSPWLPSARLGALVRWQRGRFAITADPYVQLGLLHRDLGNRAQVQLPLWLAVQPARGVALTLRTGVGGEVAVLGDAWGVPVGLGARVAITPRIDVAAEAAFVRLLGPLDEGKLRVGWLAVDVRWP